MKLRYLASFFLSLSFIFSCKKGPNIPYPSVENAGKVVTQEEANAKRSMKLSEWKEKYDFDPYFASTNITESEKGPVSITRNLIQDNNGDFWFASWEGIMSYDGKTFYNHTNIEDLRRYHMFSVYQDKAGTYWFGSIGAGLYRFDGKTYENIDSKTILPNDDVSCFFEDSKGNMWIGTANGIVSFKNGIYRTYTREDGLLSGDVNDIVEDAEGKIWIGTRGELYVYEKGAFSKYTRPDGSSFTNVRTLVYDQDGMLWLGGNDGVWRLNQGKEEQIFENFGGFICEADSGELYLGTANKSGGDWQLYELTKDELNKESYSTKLLKDQKGQIFGIMKDREGRLWFGNERGLAVMENGVWKEM